MHPSHPGRRSRRGTGPGSSFSDLWGTLWGSIFKFRNYSKRHLAVSDGISVLRVRGRILREIQSNVSFDAIIHVI